MKVENRIMKNKTRNIIWTVAGVLLLVSLVYASTITDTYTTNGNITNNNTGIYYNNQKTFARTADVVVCRGTSILDDLFKKFSCDVVCESTDTNCADDFTIAFNKLTSGRTIKETVLARGNFPITSTLTFPASNIRLIIDKVTANGAFTHIISAQGKSNIDIIFGQIDGTNFTNTSAASSAIDFETGSDLNVYGLNGYGLINNTRGGHIQRGIESYCLAANPCMRVNVQDVRLLDIEQQGIYFDDYTNGYLSNFIIDSGNATGFNRTTHALVISNNIRTTIRDGLILYPRVGGIYENRNTKGLEITGVKIYMNGTNNNELDGVEIGATATGALATQYVNMHDNFITGFANYSFLIYSGVNDSTFTNNMILNGNNASDQYQMALLSSADVYIDNYYYSTPITKTCNNASLFNQRTLYNTTHGCRCFGSVGSWKCWTMS